MMRIILLSIILVSLSWSYVYPRDPDGRYAQSKNKTWFDHLRSGHGPCCSDADGRVILDPDWESKDNHYRVRLDGKWIDVDDDAVITEPNRDGRTIVWPIYIAGETIIRCFIPGIMG